MKTVDIKYDTLKKCAEMLNYKTSTEHAIMNLKKGRMTTELTIFTSPEGIILVNISRVKTLQFETLAEWEAYKAKKFESFDSDKDMWQTFTGMDDETWEEWNK